MGYSSFEVDSNAGSSGRFNDSENSPEFCSYDELPGGGEPDNVHSNIDVQAGDGLCVFND